MDKLKYIDNLFEAKLDGAEIKPDKLAWDNIAYRLDNIKPTNVDIRKSNFRVKIVSTASIVLIAIASILIIRSCDSLPAQANSNYSEKFNNYAESKINKSQNYLAYSNLNNRIYANNHEIILVSNASNSINQDEKSNELVNGNLNSHSEIVASNSDEAANTVINTSSSESDLSKSSFSLLGLKKFKLRGLQFKNDSLVENTLIKFPTNHKLFMFDKRQSKEFSVGFAYGNSFVRNGKLVGNDVLNSANKLSGNSLFDYNLSINFKYEVNKFFIKSGVNFNSLFEKGIFEFSEEMVDTSRSHYTYEINEYITYDSIDWWVNPDDPTDTLVYYEPVLNTDTVNSKWNRVDSIYHKDYQKQIETSLRYIEIPLMIGYRHQFNRFSLAVSNGIGFAVKVGDEGYIVQGDEIRQITRKSSPYNDVVLNYIFAVDMSYKLNRRTSIFISPNYRTNLNSIYKKQIGDNRVYHSFGISAGLNFVIK